VSDRLEEVPWAELEHAYGAATDVPDLLRALGSPEPGVRENARHLLYGNIFHQGTRYEASAYAAPFLLELLADPATADRQALLELLASLAIGYDEAWLPDGFLAAPYRVAAVGGAELLRAAPLPADYDEDDSRYVYFDGLDEKQQDQVYAHVELMVYDAVRVGVPLFRTLLGDDEPGVRTAAAYALGWFGEDAAGSVPGLTAAVTDPQPAVAATALVALGLLGTDSAETIRAVESALVHPLDVVRWGAAIALARLHGPAADPRAAGELLAWTGGRSGPRADIPYNEGDLAGYAGLALRQLGEAWADETFDALLARIPEVSGPPALPIVGEALRRAFPAGPIAGGTPFEALNERQQRLLRALAATPTVWGWGEYASFGNFMSLVGAYGLPHDVQAMRAYVA
jgi:hypothetical protein